MYTLRKLKPERSYAMILLPFGAMALIAAAGAVFGLPAAYTVGAVFFTLYAAYSFLTYLKTGNPGFIVISLFQLCGGLMGFAAAAGFGQRPNRPALFFAACTGFLGIWAILLAATKRVKWRGREVLELAAASVEQTQNGYTGRPLPVGKTEFSQKLILEFAAFARRHLIAATYVGQDRVAFVPVREGREPAFLLGLKADHTDETWVCFDFAGNVSANVSQHDYLDYREALSFDKLCESLGDLFVEFAGMFQRGEGVRIIDRLEAVGLSMFS
jgi:hypothetical protein